MIAGLLILTSCFEDPGTDITWEGGTFVELDAAVPVSASKSYSYLRLNDGTTYSSGMLVSFVGTKNSGTTVSFEVDASSTAIEGVHYTTSGTSVTIPAGEFVAELPFTILADNIEAGESWTIVVNITDADVEVGSRASATHSIAIACPSDLAATYTFTTDGYIGPAGTTTQNGITGSGTITATPTSGVYTLTDYSFGVFPDMWGDSPAVGSLTLLDVCDELSFAGGDQYGDSYSFTSALVLSNGDATITFDWENTYGDGGTTSVTLDSGTWPAAINSGL